MPGMNITGYYPQFPAAMPNHGVGCRRLTHPYATDLIRKPGPFDLHA
jgi:hypothetical protein